MVCQKQKFTLVPSYSVVKKAARCAHTNMYLHWNGAMATVHFVIVPMDVPSNHILFDVRVSIQFNNEYWVLPTKQWSWWNTASFAIYCPGLEGIGTLVLLIVSSSPDVTKMGPTDCSFVSTCLLAGSLMKGVFFTYARRDFSKLYLPPHPVDPYTRFSR